jgi:hypothetical protein
MRRWRIRLPDTVKFFVWQGNNGCLWRVFADLFVSIISLLRGFGIVAAKLVCLHIQVDFVQAISTTFKFWPRALDNLYGIKKLDMRVVEITFFLVSISDILVGFILGCDDCSPNDVISCPRFKTAKFSVSHIVT